LLVTDVASMHVPMRYFTVMPARASTFGNVPGAAFASLPESRRPEGAGAM
jgi:hypothetical protein